MTKKNTPAKRPFSQDFSGPVITDQSQQRAADVNDIVAKFIQTGIDPAAGKPPQTFGFASSKEYAEVTRATAEIASAFADLPSAVRSSFSNDPGEWLDAIGQPDFEEAPFDVSEPSEEAPNPPPAEPAPQDSTPSE